tara:strand:- start:142 stop:507 length:366 start_codon:yes stop_codon:yes gene_type:complete
MQSLTQEELGLLVLWLHLPTLPQLLVCVGDARAVLGATPLFTNETIFEEALGALRDASPDFSEHHPEKSPALGSVLAAAAPFTALSDALVSVAMKTEQTNTEDETLPSVLPPAVAPTMMRR